MTDGCLVCGRPTSEPGARGGRPPLYCSTPCRRRAEFVQRRLDAIARAVDDLLVQREELADGVTVVHAAYREREEDARAKRVANLDRQIEIRRERMRQVAAEIPELAGAKV